MKKITGFLAITFLAGALTLSAQDQPKQNSKPADKKESKMCGKDCKMSCCKSKTTEKESKAPEKKN
jgi:preprotein translocase subunit SecG